MAPKSLELVPDKYRFFRSQREKPVPIPSDISLAGGTIIITGGNTGIGYAAGEAFLSMNLSRLIIAVRTPSKGEAAAAKLRAKYPNAQIDVWQVDMISYKSVQDFAKKCETLDRIDLALLNAGTQMLRFEKSPQGHETSFEVNYLSTILLATLLLPILKEKSPPGKPGRLTIVSSGTALMAEYPSAKDERVLPYYEDEANFSLPNPMPTYGAHKGLSHFWIVKLAERVKADDVVVNLVDPGLVKGTSLQDQGNILYRSLLTFAKSVTGRTVEQGASTFVHAGVVMGKESHGSYIMDWRIHHYTQLLHTSEGLAFADKVWNETYELLPVDVNGILNSM
ncbi:hypothetical protein NW762_004650 [Fusarium torreyae]|uniref:Short-chain dehydrogenase/reductase family protein n=1 Tax=Fusarium torreyae TaxID=1237075 RepID=A0A9W8S3X0_9HYPO|nr:hypothetical protein NW762_004650 [Fusarium torreyae]